MSEEKKLLEIYDSLRKVEQVLDNLINSLEEELPLGQEFDLSHPDTYLDLFKLSRNAFTNLGYSINNCKYTLQDYQRESRKKAEKSKNVSKIREIVQEERTQELETIELPTIFDKSEFVKTESSIFYQLLLDVMATIFSMIVAVLAFYGVTKVMQDFQLINRFCQTFQSQPEQLNNNFLETPKKIIRHKD